MQCSYHVQFLRNDLEQRQSMNQRYSLRAHAAKLGLHPSALSRILSGKQELSVSACFAIVPQLEFNADELKLFLLSVVEEKREKTLQKFEETFNISLRETSAQRIS